MPLNIEAMELWVAVNTQWRGGGMSLLGLDYIAVAQEADWLEIDRSPCLMKKIRKLENHVLKSQRKDKKEDKGSS